MTKRLSVSALLITLMILLLAACGGDKVLTIKASATSGDVDIRSTAADGLVTFNIYNPSGIGNADIELVAGKWPKTVQVRLFVQGLENLELSYDGVTMTAAVPTSGDGHVMEKLNKRGAETEIDSSSPYWIDIQAMPAQDGAVFFGDPAWPASFLLTLPEDFHSGGYTQFSLKWIDFYR